MSAIVLDKIVYFVKLNKFYKNFIFCEPKYKKYSLIDRRRYEDMDEANQMCPETFESLIVTVKTKMYKTAIAILKNDEDACDAIQEALLSAYKSFDKLENKKYFSTWIIRILLNKCYDLINTKLKSIKSKLNYCYKDLNEWCLKNKIYTIKEKEPIEYKPLLAVKNKLSSENILVFKINDELLKELPNIIQYINSKGYTITLLTEHLSENW